MRACVSGLAPLILSVAMLELCVIGIALTDIEGILKTLCGSRTWLIENLNGWELVSCDFD